MDALLVELLAMEESERRGDDVTVWRRGLWRRYELVTLPFSPLEAVLILAVETNQLRSWRQPGAPRRSCSLPGELHALQ